MGWPRDGAKLERVRALMADDRLDALVVRAPDNVLYLSNFWGMKGYDAVVFPAEGEPTLICLEASADDAARTAWTADVRLLKGYDDGDPRPPTARTLDLALEAARPYGRVGLELSLGTQASDRMVGEPTTYTRAWFDAWPEAVDATPLLARARWIKTAQEVERVRLANEIAGAALEHVFSLVWSGPGIRTFTATGDRPVQEHEPTLFEIWVCADGYWCDHTKNLVAGELERRYAELERELMQVYETALGKLRPGASLAELDRSIRDALAEI